MLGYVLVEFDWIDTNHLQLGRTCPIQQLIPDNDIEYAALLGPVENGGLRV
jgi:hypothetical protein